MHKNTLQHFLGGLEFADWKVTGNQKTGVENAGLENDGRSCRRGICRSGK